MNDQRTEATKKIRSALLSALRTARQLKAEELKAFDGLPESEQTGNRGEVIQDAAFNITETIHHIELAADWLHDTVVSYRGERSA